jgi:hypothetical protein
VNVGVLAIYNEFLGENNFLRKNNAKKEEGKEGDEEGEYSEENEELRILLSEKFDSFFSICKVGLMKLINLRDISVERFF